eukprot:5958645-Amphidinium_carterae.1
MSQGFVVGVCDFESLRLGSTRHNCLVMACLLSNKTICKESTWPNIGWVAIAGNPYDYIQQADLAGKGTWTVGLSKPKQPQQPENGLHSLQLSTIWIWVGEAEPLMRDEM